MVLLTACDLLGSKSYRLVFHLIEANGGEQTDPRISDVVEELRKTLQFEGYSLKGEIDIALKPNDPFSEEVDTGNGAPQVIYTFEGGLHHVVQIGTRDDEVQALSLRIDKGPSTVLETTVTIRPEQTLVLGSVPQTGAATLLIVVRMVEA